MQSLSLVMSECFLSGRGQGHVSNFYTVDLENFATASRRYTGDIHNWTVVGLFMTHCLQLNFQLHTIGLVRTCRISSFCAVAWKLARLLLTRRIARSLGDSWASCTVCYARRLNLRCIQKLTYVVLKFPGGCAALWPRVAFWQLSVNSSQQCYHLKLVFSVNARRFERRVRDHAYRVSTKTWAYGTYLRLFSLWLWNAWPLTVILFTCTDNSHCSL